jgi:hypothetical protein
LGGLLHHALLNRGEQLPPVVRNEIRAALRRVPLDTPERTAWLADLRAMRDAGPQALLAVDDLVLGHSDPHKRLAAARIRQRPMTDDVNA